MIYHVLAPARLQAAVQLPASKSISNRALILNALSDSPYEITNLSDCDDTEVLLHALNSDGNHFDIHASGTAMRFLTAFLSKIVGEWTITGTERMKQRPIRLLVDALNSVGARIEYAEKEGFPPLRIYGSALQGGEITMDGGVSSQYISALLMIAPLMEKGLTLRLTGDIVSRPYIYLTMHLMKQFGVTARWEDWDCIRVEPQEYRPVRFVVESDWSAASYWYEMMLLSNFRAEISLAGLFQNSSQGDAHVAKLFGCMGVATRFTPQGVELHWGDKLTGKLLYNFVNEPDLVQTFVVSCVLTNRPFRISGLQSLKIKETDRVEALKTEMRKLGYVLLDGDDSALEWSGERCIPQEAPVIATYEDHRMAMAFAPAALVLPEGICIADPEVVSKSYPRYWDDLRQAGFIIKPV